jgi:hypothetical protein
MELNDNAVVCTDSINPQTGEGSAGEIELYDELIAFAELPPEEQVRLESPEPSSEPREGSADNAQDCTFSEPVLSGAPVESLTSASEAEEPTEQTSLESIQSEVVEQTAPTDWTQRGSPIQPVAPAESACDSEVLTESVDVDPPVGGVPSPSGPLSGFDLPQEMVYTGAMSRGVCLACGAESGADDLFCLACGDFVDEVGSTLPSNRMCGECKERIDTGEIFCPWCGSAMQPQR